MDKHHELPPTARTPIWRTITKAAASGEFVLQVCQQCKAVQYPPRELCKECLHHELQWEKISPKGKLISYTELNASTNAFFRTHLPLQIALVKLDCGPVLFAHMIHKPAKNGDRISIRSTRDLSGEGVFIAVHDDGDEKTQLRGLDSFLIQD